MVYGYTFVAIIKLARLLCELKFLRVYWTYHYDLERIRKFDHLPPCIIDPANPCNNVYESGLKNNSGSGIIDSWRTIRHLIPTLDLTLPLQTGSIKFVYIYINSNYLITFSIFRCEQ